MNSFTQETLLELKTKVGANGKSVIEHMYFTPPLKIIDPIYEGDIANIMLLSVSAGLMKGDSQKIDINIGQNTKIKLSSQSYEKIHNTLDGKALRNTNIVLQENALLNFTPLPTIPFDNSHFENNTNIYLKDSSVLHYGEIFCAGRVSRNEVFKFNKFASKICIFCNEKMIYLDNMFLDPKKQQLDGFCMFDGFTHYLNLVIWDKHQDIECLYEKVKASGINAGISVNAYGVIVIKALDMESERLIAFKTLLGF